MMTVHKLSAGDGYTYYTREVASADELRQKSRELGDYYTVDGNPPGQWVGAGITNLGVSGDVSEEQMAALFGEGLHPNAAHLGPGEDARLGQRYRRYQVKDQELANRIERVLGDFERINHAKPDADQRRIIRTKVGGEYFRERHGRNAKDKEELGRFMTTEQAAGSNAVAGYDLVFSPAKSASVLWAVAGDEVRREIEAAHTEAIDEALSHFEAGGLYTRRGRNGVRQIDVQGGLVATRFRHYDSRTGDPQLHDHVVVSNKILGADGKWSTIDGQQLYKLNVETSEFYNQKVMEKIAGRLGAALTERKVTGDRPVVEIAGVDVDAIEVFSNRRAGITKALETLTEQFIADHGYLPSDQQKIALAQRATLETRPAKKEARRLSELVSEWTGEFTRRDLPTGKRLLGRVRAARHEVTDEFLSAGDIDVDAVAQASIERLEQDRSYWSRHHVTAQVRRSLRSDMGAAEIPESLVIEVTDTALGTHSLETFHRPLTGEGGPLTRRDGTSVYTKANTGIYTSAGVLYSQERLLVAAQTEVIPAAGVEAFERAKLTQDRELDAGQLALAQKFACGSELLSVGIGPAGAGKTTSLRLAGDTIRESGGTVIGLTPTAAAASVMSAELGARADTIDSFVLSHRTGSARIIPAPGDVIFIDEAGMVGTRLFSEAVTIAEQHGAVVRAIGDERQLSAVGSGGALRLIKNEIGATYLEDLHRFTHPDEAAATLAMREPTPGMADDPFSFYRKNNRIVAGNTDTMLEQAFTGWQTDTNAGKNSLMMAFDNDTVTELNSRAQAYRFTTGNLQDGTSAALRDGLAAYTGDTVVTRKNNRQMRVNQGKDFVKNNDAWTVRDAHDDGSLTVQHQSHGAVTTLPATYVGEHTMLGYASTIHRTQGATSDTTHAVLTASLSRALAYVAVSRGRKDNRIYLSLGEDETMDSALESITERHDTNLTIAEQMTQTRTESRSLKTMSDQYLDLDEETHTRRITTMARSTLGDTAAGKVVDTDAFAAVATQIREGEAAGFDGPGLLAKAWTERDFHDAGDVASVLAWRIEQRVDTGLQLAEETQTRPLANVTNAHLDKLAATAATDRTPARASRLADTNTAWNERIHGHLTDEMLQTRITAAKTSLATDTVINDPERHRKTTWLQDSLQSEHTIRASLDDQTRTTEAFERGAHTRRDPTAPARARENRAATITARISAEQKLRTLLPDHEPRKTRPLDVLPEWMAPSGSITAEHAPALFTAELVKRRDVIDREMVRRGWEIAEQQPTWVAELGVVPSDTVKAAQWVHLAAEVDTYRAKYNLTDIETHAVPAKYRTSETGEQLAAKVTAMHKYSELTTKEPANTEQITDEAISAEARSQARSGHTEAEQVAETLRQNREKVAEAATPSRAEHIAAMTARIRARTAQQAARTDQDPTQTESPSREVGTSPAVYEAQRKMDRLKAEEKERELRQRRQDEQSRGPSQGRGPTIGR